jgi:hypothetical protein
MLFQQSKKTIGLATRYEKTANMFMAFLTLFATRLWLKQVCLQALSKKTISSIRNMDRFLRALAEYISATSRQSVMYSHILGGQVCFIYMASYLINSTLNS